MACGVISWKTIRRTGTLGLSVSSRCQAMASPSRSSSVARKSSSASLSSAFSFAHLLLLVGADDVERLEVVVDVDAEAGPRLALVAGRHVRGVARQVADVADARLHRVAGAEEARDLLGLRRGLHDDQAPTAVAGRAPARGGLLRGGGRGRRGGGGVGVGHGTPSGAAGGGGGGPGSGRRRGSVAARSGAVSNAARAASVPDGGPGGAWHAAAACAGRSAGAGCGRSADPRRGPGAGGRRR